ncbi:hypothetical protein TheveDRAFT_1186 [Thermanaerovibrio velox DSM 12556]|uniref:Uncharacterized protein n=1 Tax=Thermanaerovibrio velox DSM 12556 TaxID=926567 RepID=H0USM1_9BACT|nr:hypothetical protein [Thermanaerovibrio velox]EHM10310.1 hypothetical protein TheveDRAFT_1186 [Thermanaerovibrio velox DSM 12556]
MDLRGGMRLFESLGFKPWGWRDFNGVRRRVAFVKGGLLGEVCRYYAFDHILWGEFSGGHAEDLIGSVRPMENVMTQRFLLWSGLNGDGKRRVRSFLFGLRGFAEVCLLGPGIEAPRGFEDLGAIAQAAWKGNFEVRGGSERV